MGPSGHRMMMFTGVNIIHFVNFAPPPPLYFCVFNPYRYVFKMFLSHFPFPVPPSFPFFPYTLGLHLFSPAAPPPPTPQYKLYTPGCILYRKKQLTSTTPTPGSRAKRLAMTSSGTKSSSNYHMRKISSNCFCDQKTM